MTETRYAKFIGKLNGMSEQEVESCEKDQALLDKLTPISNIRCEC